MKIAVIDDGIDKETAENGMHINCHYHYVNHKPKQGIRHGTKVVGIVEKYSSDTKEYEIYDKDDKLIGNITGCSTGGFIAS